MEERKKEGGLSKRFLWLLGIGIKQALTFDFPRSKSSLKTHTNYDKNVRCPTNFCHEDCPSQQSQQDDQGVLRPRHEEGKYTEILFFTPNPLKAILPRQFFRTRGRYRSVTGNQNGLT